MHLMPYDSLRPSWLEIDPFAIDHNIKVVQTMIGRERKLFVVVKADGYGCGALVSARAAARAGAYGIATSHPDLVAALRREGIRIPVLLYPCSLPQDACAIADLGVLPTLHDLAGLDAFDELGRDLDVYVKIDCGNARLGVPAAQAQPFLDRLRRSTHLRLAGLYTQFRDQDDPAELDAQAKLFDSVCKIADQLGFSNYERMAVASTTMLATARFNYTAVNPGRMIHGHVEKAERERLGLRPVMVSLRSRIIHLRDCAAGERLFAHSEPLREACRTAVVPLGYMDGLDQGPPVAGQALLRGQFVSVVVSRSMEHTVLDVTTVANATVGDEIVFFGRQGEKEIDLWDLASGSSFPPIEFISRLGAMPKRYRAPSAGENSALSSVPPQDVGGKP